MSGARIVLFASLPIFALPLRAQAQTPASQSQVELWMTQGSEAMHAGKPAEAVKPFSQAAQAQPDSAAILLDLGLAELGAGQLDIAQTELRHVLVLDPVAPGAHLFLGILEYQQGDPAHATQDIAAELKQHPDNVQALTWMGIVQLSQGNGHAAAAALDHAVQLAPKDAQALYYQGRAHSLIAIDAYKTLYQIDPDSALVHRALAESLSASGQPQKAIDEFQAALRKQPANADIYEELGDEEQKVSRFVAAAAAYRQELQLNPHSAVALYNLGKIQVEQGSPGQGVPLLQHALSLHASTAPAAFYLGLGLAQLNRNLEAAAAFQASLAADPSPFIAQSDWYQLGRVDTRMGRKADADHAFAQVQRMKAAADNGSGQAVK